MQKCDRTSHEQKQAKRTQIPHTFQNGFRTHTCDRTSQVCVRARTFATHTYLDYVTNYKLNRGMQYCKLCTYSVKDFTFERSNILVISLTQYQSFKQRLKYWLLFTVLERFFCSSIVRWWTIMKINWPLWTKPTGRIVKRVPNHQSIQSFVLITFCPVKT